MSRVLIVSTSTSYRLSPYVTAARELGAQAIVASPGALPLVDRDTVGVEIDLARPDETKDRLLRQLIRTPVDGVIATDDATVEIAAHVAASVGLPHNPPESARFTRRKDHAREQLKACGLPVPDFSCIDLTAPLMAQVETLAYPCVVKPLAMSGSRGVIRADNPAALLSAVARVRLLVQHESDPEERRFLLVEAFVPGRELAIEGMLRAGQLEVLAIFDKPDPLDGPYFEETYYVTPSRLSEIVLRRARETVAEACRAYGLREGPVHAELRIDDERIWIVEVAARTIGGMCGRLLRFGTGWSLEQLVVRHALGMPAAGVAGEGGAGVLMIPITQGGILRRVEGLLAARDTRHVEEVRIDVPDGYELVPLPEGDSYLGFMFSRAPTPAEAEAALREAHSKLRVVVAPLWKIGPAA